MRRPDSHPPSTEAGRAVDTGARVAAVDDTQTCFGEDPGVLEALAVDVDPASDLSGEDPGRVLELHRHEPGARGVLRARMHRLEIDPRAPLPSPEPI